MKITQRRGEPRAALDGKAAGPYVAGTAVKYGSLSSPMTDAKGRRFVETFRVGAFTKMLSGADVRFLVNHDKNLVLARNVSGTLEIIDDDDALRFVATPPSTSLARHYLDNVARGDMTGVSFRFYAIRDEWTPKPNGTYLRRVLDAEIDDISIVTFPAYPDNEVKVLGDHSIQKPMPPGASREERREIINRRARLALAQRALAPPRRA